MSAKLHHWRLGFRQFSFHHIARALQDNTFSVSQYSLLLRHALFPSNFRLQVNRMTQKYFSELLLAASGIQSCVTRRTLPFGSAIPALESASQTALPDFRPRACVRSYTAQCRRLPPFSRQSLKAGIPTRPPGSFPLFSFINSRIRAGVSSP